MTRSPVRLAATCLRAVAPGVGDDPSPREEQGGVGAQGAQQHVGAHGLAQEEGGPLRGQRHRPREEGRHDRQDQRAAPRAAAVDLAGPGTRGASRARSPPAARRRRRRRHRAPGARAGGRRRAEPAGPGRLATGSRPPTPPGRTRQDRRPSRLGAVPPRRRRSVARALLALAAACALAAVVIQVLAVRTADGQRLDDAARGNPPPARRPRSSTPRATCSTPSRRPRSCCSAPGSWRSPCCAAGRCWRWVAGVVVLGANLTTQWLKEGAGASRPAGRARCPPPGASPAVT